MRKCLCAALSPQTCKNACALHSAAKTRKRLRTAPRRKHAKAPAHCASPQRRENACALRSRRKHAKSACTLCSRRKDAKTPAHCALAANTRKTPAHCALAANLQKAPAHRRVPFVRVLALCDCTSRSPEMYWTFCKSAAKCQQSTLLARLGNHEQFCGNTRGTCGAQAFCTFSPYAAWLCSVLHMECLQPVDAICIAISRGTYWRAGVCDIYVVASYLYGARFRRCQHIYNMTRGFIRLHAGDRKLGIAPAPVQWRRIR